MNRPLGTRCTLSLSLFPLVLIFLVAVGSCDLIQATLFPKYSVTIQQSSGGIVAEPPRVSRRPIPVGG